ILSIATALPIIPIAAPIRLVDMVLREPAREVSDRQRPASTRARQRPVNPIPATEFVFTPAITPREIFAVDWDCCWLDDRPVACLSQWRALINAGRLPDVEGAFAIAWSDAAGELHLARDGVGGRSLFYAPRPEGLVFASSIKVLLKTGRIARGLRLA